MQAAQGGTVIDPSNIPQTVERLWQDGMSKLSDDNKEILLPLGIDGVIGVNGIATLSGRLANLLNINTVVLVDKQLGYLRIMEKPEFIAGGNSEVKAIMTSMKPATDKTETNVKVMDKKNKVPRPPNAFILYRQHHHPILKNANPDLHNNDISVILGKQWKDEDESVKNQYKEIAKAFAVKHAEDNPNYVYNPRKSSEKKKRMTARKTAISGNSAEATIAGPSSQPVTVPNGPSPSLLSSIAQAIAQAVAPSATSTTASSAATNKHTPLSIAGAQSDEDNDEHGDKKAEALAAGQVDSAPEPSTPTILKEYADGKLGATLPMSDSDLAQVLQDHNDFLDANPDLVQPPTVDSIMINYADNTVHEVSQLDTMIDWEQVGGDYENNFEFGQSEFDSFFDEELARLGGLD